MDTKEMQKLAKDSIEAFNKADWNRWRNLHAPNVVYEEIATERRLTGHDEVVAALEGWRKAFPDARGTVNNVVVGGDQAVLEVEWHGTHKGTLETPFGTLPASGMTDRTKATVILKIEKDRIVSNRHYFDLFSMLRQVGGIPEKLTKAAGA